MEVAERRVRDVVPAVPELPRVLLPVAGIRLLPLLPKSAMAAPPVARPLMPKPSNRTDIHSPGPSTRTQIDHKDWTTIRREYLRKKIEQRPPIEGLVRRHILHSDGRVSPLIEQGVRLLRQDRIRSCLRRKLERRPGPLELVTRKILQADIELEHAIQEGRVLFPSTSETAEEVDGLGLLSTDMEVVSQVSIRPPSKQINVLTNKGVMRKKPTPYKVPESILRTKAPKSPGSNEIPKEDDINTVPYSTTLDNYKALLEQQQVYLNYQKNDDQSLSSDDSSVRQVIDLQQGSPLLSHSSSSDCASPIAYQPVPRRLADLKVQELKNECKKRQLPVSGSKIQLLERLKPFERLILCQRVPSPERAPSRDILILPQPSPDPAKSSEPRMQMIPTSISSTLPPASTQTSFLQSQEPSRPAQQVINDYLQQQSRPLLVQVPSSKSGQVVQLVDPNGQLIGMATMQYSEGQQPVIIQQRQGVAVSQPQQSLGQLVQNQMGLGRGGVQKKHTDTFRFAQLGSGGQFTVVQSSTADNAKQITTAQTIANTSTVTSNGFAQKTNCTNTVASGTPTTNNVICHSNLVQSRMMSPRIDTNAQNTMIPQNTSQVVPRMNTPHESSPRAGDQAGRSPNMPQSMVSEDGKDSGSGSADDPINLEPVDPASVLTPATLQMHEEMLRAQQKTIETLMKELGASQASLKKQQQIILAAKKAQQKLREQERKELENGVPTSRGDREQWLRDLEMTHVNKQYIHQFIQQRNQQQQAQKLVSEHNRLQSTEIRLQEELHVEQAVHDIVRLIKQDARTALLIVKLLREYQLKRVQQEQQEKPEETCSTPHEVDEEHVSATTKMSEQSSDTVFLPSVPHASIQEQLRHQPEQDVSLTGASSMAQLSSSSAHNTFLTNSANEEGVVVCEAGRQPSLPQPIPYLPAPQNIAPPAEGNTENEIDMEAMFNSVMNETHRAFQKTPEENVNCNVTAQMTPPQLPAVHNGIWGDDSMDSIPSQTFVVGTSTGDAASPLSSSHSLKPPAMLPNSSQLHPMYLGINGVPDFENFTFFENGYSSIEDALAVVHNDREFALGLSDEELANMIGDDWINCAERTLDTAGEYTAAFDPDEDNGRETDPMSLGQPLNADIQMSMENQAMEWYPSTSTDMQ